MSQPSIIPLKSGHFAALDEEGNAWLALMEWTNSEGYYPSACAGIEVVKLDEVSDFMSHVTDPANVVAQIDTHDRGLWSRDYFPEMSVLGLELDKLRNYGDNEPISWTEQPSEDQQERARKILEVLQDKILESARIEAKLMSDGHCLEMDECHFTCHYDEDFNACGLSHEGSRSSVPGEWKVPIMQPDHLFYLDSEKVWGESNPS